MLSSEITSRIEALAAAAPNAKVGNLSSVAGLLRLFQELQTLGRDQHIESLAQAADATSTLIKKIMMDDVPSADASLKTVEAVANTLRSAVDLGAMPDLESFPAELGLLPAAPPEALTPYKDQDILADFLSRQGAVLEDMEVHILTLEKQHSPDSLASMLHILHTMKGDTGFLGLSGVEQLCHATEDYLQGAVFPYDVELLLTVKDWLASLFAAVSGGDQQPALPPELLARLEGTARTAPPTNGGGKAAPTEPSAPQTVQLQADASLVAEFVQESKEHLEVANSQLLALESEPTNREALNTVFRAFHTMKGISGFLGLDEISHLAHDAENLLDKVRKEDLDLSDTIMDLSFESLDMLGRLIENVRKALAAGGMLNTEPALETLLVSLRRASGDANVGSLDQERPKLGEILVEQGTINQADLNEAIESQRTTQRGRRLGSILVSQNLVTPSVVMEALQKQIPDQEHHASVQVKDTIRVDYDRLESMINTIGEMVLAESMISQDDSILRMNAESLNKKIHNLKTVTRKLQELGTSIRMVPIAGTFQKMARLVRDLSRKSGKQVVFSSKGDETELDRAFVDKIGDPLVHMIRNAVDHGIEPPEERAAAGKSHEGSIELRAFHEGGNIHVEIVDDGRGLNREAILAKALEKGLISPDDRLSDNDIYNLIFLPGFSTAKQVTEVSGRGVGMDVVKRNIEELRGYVQILSQQGKGTRFKIILPLTLALIDGMVVKVGRERYVFPVLSVVESLRPAKGIVSTIIGKGEMLSVRGRQVPLFRLSRLFGIPDAQEDPAQALVVVVEHEGRQVGLLVDDLVGMQQTVIKSLGAGLGQTAGFSGGAIMADGRVGLIVDVVGVIKLARNEYAGQVV